MYLVFILLCLLLLVGVGWIVTALVSKSRTPVAAAAAQSPFLQGPRGPQGARGLAGVTGPTGPTGPAAVKTYNGQYVVIQHRPNGNKTPVHAAEIQVFAFIEGREIALPLNAGTLQGHNESCLPYGVERQNPWSPTVRALKSRSLLDDEDLSTYVTTDGTTDSESIRIDLLREFPISRVVIYNRQDCCQDRLNECDLQIRNANDQLVYTQAFPTPAQNVYIFVWQ